MMTHIIFKFILISYEIFRVSRRFGKRKEPSQENLRLKDMKYFVMGVYMKVAVIGSRELTVENLGAYLPEDTTEIISGGARGIDTCAKKYAVANGIKLTEFLPEYEKYGRVAPLKRNITIIENADCVLAFWDGESRGTKFVIDNCRQRRIDVKVFYFTKDNNWVAEESLI